MNKYVLSCRTGQASHAGSLVLGALEVFSSYVLFYVGFFCVFFSDWHKPASAGGLSGRFGSSTVEENTGKQLQDGAQSSTFKYFIYYCVIMCI